MAREPIPTWCFVLIAVRRGAEWLLVREAKHGQRWYLPAGRVEPGETFVEAAHRETLEEAGIPIELTGVVRVEHTPRPDGTARCRVILLASPADDTPPKQTPDSESLEADWFRLDQMPTLDLRGREVLDLFAFLATHPPIAPLSFLRPEQAAFG